MAYIPKHNKVTVSFKQTIPFLVLSILVVSFFYSTLMTSSSLVKDTYSICELSNEKTKEKLTKPYKDTFEIRDYLYYGDSLALFPSKYSGDVDDSLSGKTMVLKNICSDKEFSFVVEKGLNRQIILNRLDPGFYEVYIIEDLIQKRIVYLEDLRDSFVTSKNSDVTHKLEATLIANGNFANFSEGNVPNYLFLEVEAESKESSLYDVAIDPAGNDTDFTYEVNKGNIGNGLEESTESYNAALKLKTELENKGLRVILLRAQQEVVNTYGKDGRMERAYASGAKYYIRLGFNESSDATQRGIDIRYSAHASDILAKQMMFDLTKNTSMIGDTLYISGKAEAGVVISSLREGELDGREVYDDDMWIRESGGKATQAGMYSLSSEEGTSSFAKNNNKGMFSLNVSLGYLSNVQDVEEWNNHQDKIIQSMSHSILMYLGVE